MGSTPLRKFLISLCNDTHWKYSVFWRLKHQTPQILTCEDGYYDETKPEEILESKPFGDESEERRIGVVVANMSRYQYAVGEGLIGDVAYTGKHMWVSISSFFSSELESKLVPDWTEKWLLQLALGIKTILLVPAFPYGVIQLGSLEEVAENPADVCLVRDRFDSYRKMTETIPFMSTITCPRSSLSFIPVDNVCSSSTGNLVKYEKVEDFGGDGSKTTSNHEICSSSKPEIFDTKMFELSCLEEELGDMNPEHLEGFFNEVNRNSSGDMEIQLFGSDFCIKEGIFNNHLYSFNEDGELHYQLQDNTYKITRDSSFLIDDAFTDDSSWVLNITDPSWHAQGTDSGHLSEAVTTNLFIKSPVNIDLEVVTTNLFSRSSDDPSSSPSNSVNSPRQPSFGQAQVQSKEVPAFGNHLNPLSLSGPLVFDRVDSSASLDCMASTVINNVPRVKIHDRTAKKSSIVKTGRAKNTTHRTRPRDRQLIQDRVKELRELVPNGSKCSIDGLLDRTIKHMLYLNTVADQAEKLKGLTHLELDGIENQMSCESYSKTQSGTSWALECGTGSSGCPIVVKDLEFPGHMLIEVFCDDHGLFLEIAQLIRRLDLTILKGSMENRSSKMWADFVVEATKGFHRMEIFWPLLHLLQRKRTRIHS